MEKSKKARKKIRRVKKDLEDDIQTAEGTVYGPGIADCLNVTSCGDLRWDSQSKSDYQLFPRNTVGGLVWLPCTGRSAESLPYILDIINYIFLESWKTGLWIEPQKKKLPGTTNNELNFLESSSFSSATVPKLRATLSIRKNFLFNANWGSFQSHTTTVSHAGCFTRLWIPLFFVGCAPYVLDDVKRWFIQEHFGTLCWILNYATALLLYEETLSQVSFNYLYKWPSYAHWGEQVSRTLSATSSEKAKAPSLTLRCCRKMEQITQHLKLLENPSSPSFSCSAFLFNCFRKTDCHNSCWSRFECVTDSVDIKNATDRRYEKGQISLPFSLSWVLWITTQKYQFCLYALIIRWRRLLFIFQSPSKIVSQLPKADATVGRVLMKNG